MRDYKKLKVFHRSHQLVILLYQVTKIFPSDEKYDLTRQMKRSAISIPSNIVEGCARHTKKEYLRFLDIAYGSACELNYQLQLATDLGLLDKEPNRQMLSSLCMETVKMLGALQLRLRHPDSHSP